jgi:hypothetical protein
MIEGPEESADEAMELLVSCMRAPEKLFDTQVEFTVDGSAAKTWYEAK